MELKKFAETVKNNIRDFLPEEYRDAKLDVVEHRKLNETYVGLTVRREDQVIAPTINLENFHEAYENGIMNMDMILEKMSDMVQMNPPGVELSSLMDYDKAKDHLFIRVSSLEKNRDLVEQAPHVIHEDLVVTYHIATEVGAQGMSSTMVNNIMMEHFGINQQQLHEDAMRNAPEMLPARVMSMNDMMRDMMLADMRDSGLEDDMIDSMLADMGVLPENPMTVVTNEQTMNGASSLFYPEMMEQLGERLQGDYFILPSSVHEVLVIPDNGEFDHETLKGMVTEINATQVMPQDRLTDEVYHYDAKDRVFEKAATFEQRQKAKAMDKTAEHGGEKKAAPVQEAAKPKKHKSHDMSL